MKGIELFLTLTYDGDLIQLPHSSKTPLPDNPEECTVSLPVRCSSCDAVNHFSDTLRRVEVEERSMGNEIRHVADNVFNCKKCQTELSLEISVIYYAGEADWDYDCLENCAPEKTDTLQTSLD